MPIKAVPDEANPTYFAVQLFDMAGGRPYKQFASRLEAEVHVIKTAGPKSQDDLNKVSGRAVVQWFCEKQLDRGILEHTIERYRVSFAPFLGHCGDAPFSELTEEPFVEIRDELVASSSSTTTIRNKVMDLQQLVNDACLRKIIEYNPARIAFLPIPKALEFTEAVRSPADDELTLIREHGTPNAVAFVDCMTEAATRLFETTWIRWVDCDFDQDMLKVRGTPTFYDPDGEILARWVPMSLRLKASLLRLKFLYGRDLKEHVFTNTAGGILGISTVAPMLYDLQSAVGLTAEPVEEGRWRARPERQKQRKRGDKPVRARGKFTAVNFRHYGAIRWAKQVSKKVLADRLGLGVAAVERLYGHIYAEQEGRCFLLNRRKQN